MAKKREFMVWLYFGNNDLTYKYVKNWKEAIYYAKKSLSRKDVKGISIDARKTAELLSKNSVFLGIR